MKTPSYTTILCGLIVVFIFTQCSSTSESKVNAPPPKSMVAKEPLDPLKNKGVGPVKEIVLGPLDQTLVDEGKVLFEQLCTACHKIDKKFIGPSPAGILERRTPEWVMNMVMNPEEMVQKDPLAKQLLIEANGAPMANQNVSESEARKILEYFRTL